MLYELIRAIVQRVLQDKILMGLIIILVVGFFMAGMNSKDEPAMATRGSSQQRDSADASEPGPPTEQQQQQAEALDPKLATDFVKWWLGGAMDYATASAAANHEQAFAWMTRDAQVAFQSAFWPPQMAQAIASGQMVAAFHLAEVNAEAINPDGSVVVGISGTLVTDTGSQPATHVLTADFLVRREPDGLRIAGVHNRITTNPGPSVY